MFKVQPVFNTQMQKDERFQNTQQFYFFTFFEISIQSIILFGEARSPGDDRGPMLQNLLDDKQYTTRWCSYTQRIELECARPSLTSPQKFFKLTMVIKTAAQYDPNSNSETTGKMI
jgi:hypothetical protein